MKTGKYISHAFVFFLNSRVKSETITLFDDESYRLVRLRLHSEEKAYDELVYDGFRMAGIIKAIMTYYPGVLTH